MATKTAKKKLTKTAILKAIDSGATTMTAVVKALGYRSVCGGTTRRIRELVPDIDQRLGGTKGKTVSPRTKPSKTKAVKRTAKTKALARADTNPFRKGSAYGTCYDLLVAAGEKGLGRGSLVDQLTKRMPRKEGESDESLRRRAYFNVTVIASSREDGSSHKSISNRAADVYFVVREGSWLKLVLRDRKY